MIFVKPAIGLVFLALNGIGNVMAAEEAKYTVVLKDQNFEVREYEPHVLAETIVDGDFDQAGNKAFRRLFKYISGNNNSRQKIEMASPVSQESESEKIAMTSPVGQQKSQENWAVSFMMPASYSINMLPKPKDPKITLRQVKARQIAAIRYSGFWNEKSYLQHKNKLDVWIKKQRLTVIGEPIWARYNAPFTPWFMRRNEILVPVVNMSKED